MLFFSLLLSCSSREVIFIDDVERSKYQLEKLDSSEIFSYTRYSGLEAPHRYYSGSEAIVIVVKTKTVETRLQQERYSLLSRFRDSADKGADVLFVVDGVQIMPDNQKYLRMLSSNQLSDVDTLKWDEAKKIFGSAAKRITVLISTYDPKFNYAPDR